MWIRHKMLVCAGAIFVAALTFALVLFDTHPTAGLLVGLQTMGAGLLLLAAEVDKLRAQVGGSSGCGRAKADAAAEGVGRRAEPDAASDPARR
jgi:hypothetical protein